ncbi:alpha/beta fold hydrolase [Lacticaseibacillus zeae]|uniref:Alpha/beta hydrolase n=1 Tax=Lacticaseibacillus zeae subsp. silagei TaxID=3068307 RepID=A0ABD7Z7E2_LACZE|nr:MULTISPECIES: alpha/beta hydrolase [Lacticaseibacillus]MDE3315840.1 alpha/beta hydrolase [Lacticaseibacillus zeae]OFR91430.1 alpha/beta hydrolase [Lactobacillus sp. HMSC068F07]WLV82889.1 alpha/beta hydrolase [Lacticaseibacillus sp. NCIMB 15475]WLV85630.1 alpha/beta hydrolase [Lacticaseibacillus sp. NCIMB 15474]
MPEKFGLHYQTFGSGQPIFFLHGMGLDSHSMAAFYEPRLTGNEKTGYTRIYLDLPGMGGSPATAALRNADDVLAQLHHFIQAASQGQSYLVGHSYGGYLALGLLARFPTDFLGAFLTAPVVIADKASRHVAKLQHVVKDDVTSDAADFADYLNMNVVISHATWQQYQQLIRPAVAHFDRPFWDAMKMRHDYRFSFESRLASMLQEPVTMLLGQNDNEVGYQDQLDFANGHDHVHTTLIQNAGHNLMMDTPDQVMQTYHRFIQESRKNDITE